MSHGAGGDVNEMFPMRGRGGGGLRLRYHPPRHQKGVADQSEF